MGGRWGEGGLRAAQQGGGEQRRRSNGGSPRSGSSKRTPPGSRAGHRRWQHVKAPPAPALEDLQLSWSAVRSGTRAWPLSQPGSLRGGPQFREPVRRWELSRGGCRGSWRPAASVPSPSPRSPAGQQSGRHPRAGGTGRSRDKPGRRPGRLGTEGRGGPCPRGWGGLHLSRKDVGLPGVRSSSSLLWATGEGTWGRRISPKRRQRATFSSGNVTCCGNGGFIDATGDPDVRPSWVTVGPQANDECPHTCADPPARTLTESKIGV